MRKLVQLGGCLLFAAALATTGCGGTGDLPEEQTDAAGEFTELHHNSPDEVFERVDDYVSDTHNDAIDSVLDMQDELDSTMNQDGDSSDDATTAAAQDGDVMSGMN